jgi:alkanesulfonate monooxygenase SsuD/methylene tetrahydromethanopterin reductase-like flavin-dependent oxidoreductase (luciferase family)
MGAASGAGLPVLGVTLPQFNADPGPALAAARDARRLGFAGAFVFDHLWPLGAPAHPALECWTLLAALAAQSGGGAGGFRVGTLVTRAGLRAPALVARMAATVGQLAGVPPIVGVGRGDLGNRDENLAFGLPFGGAAERSRAVADTVAALRGPLARSRPTGAPLRDPDPSNRGTPSGFPRPLRPDPPPPATAGRIATTSPSASLASSAPRNRTSSSLT